MTEPEWEYVCEIRVKVAPDIHLGRSADEVLTFTPIVGGSVAGPLLSGRVLPSGGDWAVTRGETAQLEARYLIEADDGAVIDILNRGYFRASAEVISRLGQNQTVHENEYYFRTAPVFNTDSPGHRWLTESQFIGLARDEDGLVCVRVFVLR